MSDTANQNSARSKVPIHVATGAPWAGRSNDLGAMRARTPVPITRLAMASRHQAAANASKGSSRILAVRGYDPVRFVCQREALPSRWSNSTVVLLGRHAAV